MSKQNLLGTIVFLGFVVLSNSVFIVSETQRGVLLKFGEVVRADLQPGLHWKVPFVDSVRKFDDLIQRLKEMIFLEQFELVLGNRSS